MNESDGAFLGRTLAVVWGICIVVMTVVGSGSLLDGHYLWALAELGEAALLGLFYRYVLLPRWIPRELRARRRGK